jgi:hypothetical protein
MLPPSGLLLFMLVLLLALIPARRLYLAGWGSVAVGVYVLLLVTFALVVAELRGPARLLVPLLGLVYVVPFFTIRNGVARAFGVRRAPVRGIPPPPRDVTPRDETPREATTSGTVTANTPTAEEAGDEPTPYP